MVIAAIILAILGIAFLVFWIAKGFFEGLGVISAVCIIAAFIFALFAVHFSISDEQLTGYIYSSDNTFGYTTGHLRFSENAGTDAQPSFCVKSDTPQGKMIREYAGSGKKVKINIPTYFYWSNNPFACGTTKMTIEEVK